MPAQLPFLPRDLLDKYFGRDPRLVRAFEDQAQAVASNSEIAVAATDALADATVLTLSPNAGFNAEYVLGPGDGTRIDTNPGTAAISVDQSVARTDGNRVEFAAPGAVNLGLPAEGNLISDAAPANLLQPTMSGLVNAASDAAAASAGVPILGIYHNAGALRIRLV